MAACGSCGAANPEGAARCQYCDQPLGGSKVLEVSWQARSREGVAGSGTVRVHAPAGASSDRVRAAVEAAFAAVVDELGAAAPADQIEAGLRERVAALLPDDHVVDGLSLATFEARSGSGSRAPIAAGVAAGVAAGAASGAASAGAGGCVGKACGALVLLGLGLFCLVGGVAMLLDRSAADEADRVARARVVAAGELGAAQGWVCIEGVLPEVPPGEALTVDGEEGAYVYLEEKSRKVELVRRSRNGEVREERREKGATETETHRVQRFGVGGADVRVTTTTEFLGAEQVVKRELPERTVTYSGIPADVPLTVAGTAKEGYLAAEVVAAAPNRDALVAQLRKKATNLRVGGFLCAGFGAILALCGVVLVVVRWR